MAKMRRDSSAVFDFSISSISLLADSSPLPGSFATSSSRNS